MPKIRKKSEAKKRIEQAKSVESKERQLTITHHPETDEYEIQKKAIDTKPERKVRFPKDIAERYQLMPDEFENVQKAIEALNHEKREMEVYSTSLESYLGYDSLLRIMGKHFGQRIAYYRSEIGGNLTVEEARKKVYRRNITDKEAIELFEYLTRMPTEFVDFNNLLELNDNSPAMAQNLWEMIKREAAREFESGHRAAAAFEPADYMTEFGSKVADISLTNRRLKNLVEVFLYRTV